MARYIDAERADIETIHTSYMGYSSKADIVDWLQSQPTADVEEVKHGEWIDNFVELTTLGGNGIPKEYVCGYKCSLCGRKELQKESYCNCGAKMDGGKAE